MEREKVASLQLRQSNIELDSATNQLREAQTGGDKAEIRSAQTTLIRARDDNARARQRLDRAQYDLNDIQARRDQVQYRSDEVTRRAIKIFTFGSLFGLAAIVVLVGAYLSIAAGQRLKYNQRVAIDRIKNADRKTPDDSGSRVEALIRANGERLEAYHSLVTTYAESSRLTARVVIGSGFVFLLLSCGVAMLGSNKTVVVASAAISAVGAVFTGYVANVVLRNSEGSSREVQAFFNHPIQVERMLAAERLSESLDARGAEQAKLAIINALVAPGGDSRGLTSAPKG
jgi:hypothetical protein